jgi:hypothetical protein
MRHIGGHRHKAAKEILNFTRTAEAWTFLLGTLPGIVHLKTEYHEVHKFCVHVQFKDLNFASKVLGSLLVLNSAFSIDCYGDPQRLALCAFADQLLGFAHHCDDR